MSSILVSQAAGVLTITLNRPEKLNAFNPEMHQLLRQAIERDLQREAGFSADYREGVSAFMEKREPRYQGK
jgi:enoyl-CoA hydratase/carnithine racemase